MNVRIVNPISGRTFIKRKAAENHVNRGLAVFVGKNSLKFLRAEGDYRERSIALSRDAAPPRSVTGRWADQIQTASSLARAVRKEREDQATGSHTELEWLELVVKFSNRCARCSVSGEDRHLTKDHITPISKGGTHSISNIQPLCGPCNSWKGAREIDFRVFSTAARSA